MVCLRFLIFTLQIGKFYYLFHLDFHLDHWWGRMCKFGFFMWTTHNSHKEQSFICLFYLIMIEFILWITFEVYVFLLFKNTHNAYKCFLKTKVGNIIIHFETNDLFIKGGGSIFWPKCEINLLCHRSLFTHASIFFITQLKLWLNNEWLCHI